MTEKYIKVSSITEKLRKAEESGRTLYIGGVSGVGKTAAVKNYYKGRPHLYLSCADGHLSGLESGAERIVQPVVIIDDLTFLEDENGREVIRKILGRKDLHTVLIGRSGIPEWLRTEAIRRRFMKADLWDLLLNEEEIRAFYEKSGIDTKNLSIRQIREDTLGFAPEVISAGSYLEMGKTYGPDIFEAVKKDTYQYLRRTAFDFWSADMKDLAIRMSVFESFDLKMLKIITGNADAGLVMDKLFRNTDALLTGSDGIWSIRPRMREYLKFAWNFEYSDKKRQDTYNRAGIYYELEEDAGKALHYYDLAGNREKIYEVLVRNAEKHAGVAQLYETKDYYLNLPEKMVVQSPVLMAGMSMLHSLLLQPAKSEYWYRKLRAFEKSKSTGSAEKKTAAGRLLYLDVALPHRGSANLIRILGDAAKVMRSGSFEIPEMSVTGNMPSVMSGGKDFCEWSKKDKFLAATIGKSVSLVLGKFGRGLVDLALAESSTEKGTMNDYEAITLLNRAYTQAETGGKIEMCFVATALMARVHIANGKLSVAESLLDDFREKAVREKADYLIPNLDAFRQLFPLLRGRRAKTAEWLAEAPNENLELRLLDRYRYLIKARAYMALNRPVESLALLERLDYYFTNYDRVYNHLEANILKSIILYRLKLPEWKEQFIKTLQNTQEYHFIPIVAREGAAVYPLFLESTEERMVLDQKYRMLLENETKKMAGFYPDYLKTAAVEANTDFTDIERTILTLLCKGAPTGQICEFMNISYSTLKFHNRSIYRKLQVRNRIEAVTKAKKLGLSE